MGSAGVGDQAERITSSQLPRDRHPVGQGMEDVTKRFPQLRLGVGQIQILGQKGEILVTAVAAPLVIVGPFMGPDFFAERSQILAGIFGQGAEFGSGMEADEDIPQVKKNVRDGLAQADTLSPEPLIWKSGCIPRPNHQAAGF